MNFLLLQLLKAALRIEKKLDEILRLTVNRAQNSGDPFFPPQPLSNPVQGACPLCQRPIIIKPVAIPDLGIQVPVRVCGCEPQTNELPVNQGDIL